MEAGIGAVALLVEQRFAVPGDILWAGVAIVMFGSIGVLYSPEILRWISAPPRPDHSSTSRERNAAFS